MVMNILSISLATSPLNKVKEITMKNYKIIPYLYNFTYYARGQIAMEREKL